MEISADIAIIGSGITCSITLTKLFEQIITDKPNRPLKVMVVEKYPELWKGIPYGSRSQVNGLTITTIYDFFTDEIENQQFFKWFVGNLDHFIAEIKSRGGDAGETWLAHNSAALANHLWNDIYVPRFVIGDYLQHRLLKLKALAETHGLIKLETIKGEATAIAPANDGYKITIKIADKATEIYANKAVLAIGSAPEKKLSNVFDNSEHVLYIDRLYTPSMDDNIALLNTKLEAVPLTDRNILIVGTNASTIELLYLINNTPQLLAKINKITLLSTSGKLPAHINYSVQNRNVSANLSRLEKRGGYTVEMLVDAAAKDITAIVNEGVSVPDVDNIVGHALRLLQPLDNESKKQFYGIYGVHLAKLFRRSGTDYKRASDLLGNSGKLEILKGSLISIAPKDNFAALRYFDLITQKETEYKQPFRIVINNTGSEDLINSSSPLIQSLVRQNNLKVNYSRKAFEVNDKLEAAPNLYIIGPLLGGNYNNLLRFWHLENASRIMYLAPYLVKELLNK